MRSLLLLKPVRNFLLALLIFSTQNCYHYRVLNTNNDPSTEYQKRVVWSYCWGLINKPKDLHVPNCSNSNALDEVQFTKKFGHTLLTLVTLGVVAPVEVKWKCHKPCQVTDSL